MTGDKPDPASENMSIVEIDAVDLEEWERDRHTPAAPKEHLAALVRQTTKGEAEAEQEKRATGDGRPATRRAQRAVSNQATCRAPVAVGQRGRRSQPRGANSKRPLSRR